MQIGEGGRSTRLQRRWEGMGEYAMGPGAWIAVENMTARSFGEWL